MTAIRPHSPLYNSWLKGGTILRAISRSTPSAASDAMLLVEIGNSAKNILHITDSNCSLITMQNRMTQNQHLHVITWMVYCWCISDSDHNRATGSFLNYQSMNTPHECATVYIFLTASLSLCPSLTDQQTTPTYSQPYKASVPSSCHWSVHVKSLDNGTLVLQTAERLTCYKLYEIFRQ